jgi:hypothetical protein
MWFVNVFFLRSREKRITVLTSKSNRSRCTRYNRVLLYVVSISITWKSKIQNLVSSCTFLEECIGAKFIHISVIVWELWPLHKPFLKIKNTCVGLIFVHPIVDICKRVQVINHVAVLHNKQYKFIRIFGVKELHISVTLDQKAQYLNGLEKYHIHKITKQNLQRNNLQIEYQNPIFDMLNKPFK